MRLWVSRLALIGGILAVQFVALEAGLRTFNESEASPGFQELFIDDSRTGYRPNPGAKTRYTTPEFSTELAINAQGVRDDRDIGPKAPNERRIVVLGDSLVLSVQVELNQTFCKLLEARLNREDPSHQWRVINAGVQGYNAVHEYLFYRHIAEAFQPDLVLVASFVGNAPMLADKQEWLDSEREPDRDLSAKTSTGLRKIVRSSMVLQLVRLRTDQLRARFAARTKELPLATYLAQRPSVVDDGLRVAHNAMAKIAERARAQGAKTAIILMPARFQVEDGDYGRLAEMVNKAGGTLVRNQGTQLFASAYADLGVPVFDLLPALMRDADRPTLFFERNVHFTMRGHTVVADILFDYLKAGGFVR